MNFFTKIIMITFLVILNTHGETPEKYEPNKDYRFSTQLNLCMFTADISEGTQIARQTHPDHTIEQAIFIVTQVLQKDRRSKWYILKIQTIMMDTWANMPVSITPSSVFYMTYNKCIKNSKTTPVEVDLYF